MLDNRWFPSADDPLIFVSEDQKLRALRSDMYFTAPEHGMQAATQAFAEDNELFLKVFATAFAKTLNLDRFDGPAGNACAAAAVVVPVVVPEVSVPAEQALNTVFV